MRPFSRISTALTSRTLLMCCIIVALVMIALPAVAQPPPPPPPNGAPIDGFFGILVMIAGALLGKRFLNTRSRH